MVGFPCGSRVAALGAALAVLSASAVWAVNPGQLDPSFGQGGWATVVFDFAPWDGLQATRLVAAQDGRIFACGEAWSWYNADSDIALAALTSSGELDPTFDGDGRQVLPFDLIGPGQGDDGAYGIALAPDGALVVVGLAEYAEDYFVEAVAARERREAGGWKLDATFAGDGKFVWDLGGGGSLNQQVVDVRVLDDARIIAGGNRMLWGDTFHVPWVSRLLKSSESDETALDPTFGDQGIFRFGDSTQWHDIGGIDVSPTGGVVAAGVTGGDNGSMLVFRLLDNGQLDSSFAGTGWRTIDLPNHGGEDARAVAVAPDGSVLLAGDDQVGGAGYVLVVRLLESGDLDSGFGTGGYLIVDSAQMGTVARANAIALQGDGRAVIAGEVYGNEERFFALRLTREGALDPTFGSGGLAILTRPAIGQLGGAQSVGAWDMAMQADGRILLLGDCPADGGMEGFCIARLDNDYVFGDGFEGGSTRGWTSVCLAETCPERPQSR